MSTLMITVGRIGVSSLFLLGGLNKIINWDRALDAIQQAGLLSPTLILPLVISLELVGGFLVAAGRWRVASAAIALAAFTLATNILFHNFWDMQGERAAVELSLFFKNISIASALVLIAGMHVRPESP